MCRWCGQSLTPPDKLLICCTGRHNAYMQRGTTAFLTGWLQKLAGGVGFTCNAYFVFASVEEIKPM
eukprot:12476556-Prorocentrum_lima.AAC.1